MEKVLLIIPAYNEAENISRVMDELSKWEEEYEYIVINDGSKDATREVCEKNNYNYLDMPINVGLAETFRTGMKYAVRYGYTMAIQYDGDGQHDPKYIKDMISRMQQTDADVVIGSRFVKDKRCKSFRNFGSYIIQVLIGLTTKVKIKDPTSGMRLYSSHVMRFLADEINMSPEPDTIAYLMLSGFKVEEVSVRMRERQAGISYLNFGNSIRYMLNVCISLIFIQRLRRKK